MPEESYCIVEGCGVSPTVGRGWCRKHYGRWWNTGTTDERSKTVRESCVVDGCDRLRNGQGYCRLHYSQAKRSGQLGARQCVVEGCTGWVEAHDMCWPHRRRLLLYGDPLAVRKPNKGEGGGHTTKDGYRVITCEGHPNAWKHGDRMFEHVLVMSKWLDRPLRPGETVHHRNGIGTDNQIENLEVMVRHPSGQRPADLVAFARQILAEYAVEVDAGLHD